ncbi:MAG TPA: hypothetical protein VED41_08400 [Solirubrobacteraceae bacterium]|nr:hypothetical protein [Solirubrobacteraceae bacterium]
MRAASPALPRWLAAQLVGAGALAAALVAVWLAVDPRTPDLAAQLYRVDLYRQLGFSVWDEHWYGGHGLPAYSLLFPPLAALVGMRVLAALSVLASSALFAWLAGSVYGRAARWGSLWFALAALGDIWSGRLTFAFGVPLALAAALALARERWLIAGALAALCAAASPVAGALLGLAALSLALAQRRARALVVLVGPGALVVAVLVALFPEGGYEPYPLLSFAATALAVAAFLWALPRSPSGDDAARLLRMGAYVYLLACLACLAVHTPVGSNVERYGVLLAGPLLLCARASAGMRLTPVAALALAVIAVWVAWGPVRETLAVAGEQATSASYYAPLERFLAGVQAPPAQPVRVEVPLTRSHWEAALLAPSVSLARGWEKQLEERYDGVLLGQHLTAAGYERWLHEEAVAYVALPDAPLDPSSAREGRLIRGGLPYLREVFKSTHWRVFGVLSPTPLLSGPGRLTALGHDSFALRARSGGRFVVRVRFTRYFTLTRGTGCVAPAPGGWTELTLRAGGPAVVSARFSLARALGGGDSCRGGDGPALGVRAGST